MKKKDLKNGLLKQVEKKDAELKDSFAKFLEDYQKFEKIEKQFSEKSNLTDYYLYGGKYEAL